MYWYISKGGAPLIGTVKDDSDRHGMDASAPDALDLREVGGLPPLEVSPSVNVLDDRILPKVHSRFAQQAPQL